MTDESAIRTRLNDIFRTVLDDDKIEIFDAMTAADVDEWDSLNHVNLIVAVERTFKVRFTTKEISALANVGEFIQLIRRKVG